tara:strand:- start:513 stop:695 length:183 start_codon:yes stop_codon:yes gene_type:complete
MSILKPESFYMHTFTGSIDTGSNWLADCKTWNESWEENVEMQKVRAGSLVECTKEGIEII